MNVFGLHPRGKHRVKVCGGPRNMQMIVRAVPTFRWQVDPTPKDRSRGLFLTGGDYELLLGGAILRSFFYAHPIPARVETCGQRARNIEIRRAPIGVPNAYDIPPKRFAPR